MTTDILTMQKKLKFVEDTPKKRKSISHIRKYALLYHNFRLSIAFYRFLVTLHIYPPSSTLFI